MSAATPRAVVLYILFAGLAVAVNVLVQRAVFALFGDVFDDSTSTLWLAMCTGAAVALGLKYLLDRRYVFQAKGPATEGEFLAYALTGGAITAVFFAVEYVIWMIFQTATARDIGIVVGMTIGYALKFLLDRRLVFKTGDDGGAP